MAIAQQTPVQWSPVFAQAILSRAKGKGTVSENVKLPFDINIEFEIFKIGP